MAVAKTPVLCCNYVSENGNTAVICINQPNTLCNASFTRGNETFNIVNSFEAPNCGGCHPRKVKPE